MPLTGEYEPSTLDWARKNAEEIMASGGTQGMQMRGMAVILLTIFVRLCIWPIHAKSMRTMKRMGLLAPMMKELQEKYKDNPQEQQMEVMKLYRDYGVNPLGGCLPLIIQMPIFLALYYMLMGSVELRHAPFALWITDLSVKDPFFVLPILMGASMWYLQKMSPTTITDPMQQKVMQFMPIIFTFMFLWFPAGLTLYWLVSNVISITQQTIIYRQLEKKGLHTRS